MDTEKMIKRIQLLSLSCDLKTEEGTRHFHCGHEYVEIGGIKWATMNVGAEKPTDYGLYFQWGDVQGYTADQVDKEEKYFGWGDYKYRNCTVFSHVKGITKYNETDGKTVLDLEDDAVSFHWGGSWRMPTNGEIKALHNTINIEWITNYNGSGINGYLFVDKTDNSKTLFFPAAGYCCNGRVNDVGSYGDYWSNSLNTIGNVSIYYFYFGSSYCGIGCLYRYFGLSVRGVVGG